MDIETPCTCGHAASSHNSLDVCFAPDGDDPALFPCDCPDFTSDDTAVAKAVGALVENPTAVTS